MADFSRLKDVMQDMVKQGKLPLDNESWRVGRSYRIHVYEGDRPVATFHRPEDAAEAVAAVNTLRAAPQQLELPLEKEDSK